MVTAIGGMPGHYRRATTGQLIGLFVFTLVAFMVFAKIMGSVLEDAGKRPSKQEVENFWRRQAEKSSKFTERPS